ncbi:Caspase-9, partial [Opisthocomus hoazin]
LQSAGSRGEQARQLVIDLETRGKRAFPVFLSILRDTGQGDLADMLSEACERLPAPPQPVDLRPVELALTGEKHNKIASERSARGECVTATCACQVYEVRADPCGYCLILNNVTFSRDSHLSNRDGSDVDCEKLEKRLRALRFHVLTREAREMVSELQKLARRDHGALDCCVVVILSHGCQTSHNQFPGGVYGTDGKPISVEKIVNYFNGSNSPSLRGKPKLFFIQACGGEQRDRGCVVDFDAPHDEAPSGPLELDATPFWSPLGNVDEPDAVASLPTPSDILVSYSTFPGFVSWREASRGSWYVQKLDNVLEQHARAEDLLTMLLRVANAVSAEGTYKQMPGCFNFLRKKFFFPCK